MNEAELQDVIAETAKLGGWTRAHFRPARTVHGWRTPGQYEAGEGWPDLVLLRGPECLVWELKSAAGKLGPGQQDWLEAWAQVPGVEAAVVRPADCDAAIARLLVRPLKSVESDARRVGRLGCEAGTVDLVGAAGAGQSVTASDHGASVPAVPNRKDGS